MPCVIVEPLSGLDWLSSFVKVPQSSYCTFSVQKVRDVQEETIFVLCEKSFGSHDIFLERIVTDDPQAGPVADQHECGIPSQL